MIDFGSVLFLNDHVGGSKSSGKKILHHFVDDCHCFCQQEFKCHVLHVKSIKYAQANLYFIDLVYFLKKFSFKLDSLNSVSEVVGIINVSKLYPRAKS